MEKPAIIGLTWQQGDQGILVSAQSFHWMSIEQYLCRSLMSWNGKEVKIISYSFLQNEGFDQKQCSLTECVH